MKVESLAMDGLQKNRRKVRAFQRLLTPANWIAALPNRVTQAPFRLRRREDGRIQGACKLYRDTTALATCGAGCWLIWRMSAGGMP